MSIDPPLKGLRVIELAGLAPGNIPLELLSFYMLHRLYGIGASFPDNKQP